MTEAMLHRFPFARTLAAVLTAGLAAVGCFAETGEAADEGLVGETAQSLTAEQLTCEGYDSAFADKLSAAGLKRDGQKSQHRCYSYVKKHIAAATGKAVPTDLYSTKYGGSAYQFANWARNNPSDLASLGFKEVTLGKDERPPKGSIIVWARGQCGFSAAHGHIEVVVDDGGRACSDFCGKIRTTCGSPTVFIPTTGATPASATDGGPPCPTKDGGADAAHSDAASDARADAANPADASADARADVVLKDSCAGRSDGWYCSELVTYSSYQCKGQQIALGFQCGAGQSCQSSGPNHAAVMQNNVPACN